MAIKLTTKGETKVIETIRKASGYYGVAASIGLYKVGELILEDAVKRVPIDTSALHDSAFITRPGRGQLRIEFGFDSPYAVSVHEKTSVHHERGSAKFLRKAVDAAMKSFTTVYGREVLAALKSGATSSTGKFPASPPGGGSKQSSPSSKSKKRHALAVRIRRAK